MNRQFILIINAVENVIEVNAFRLQRRHLRDSSDPLSLPEESFRSIYRLSRELASNLVETLINFMPDGHRSTCIPKYIKGSYQKAVGQDFFIAVSQSSVSRCITEVNSALENLQYFIPFPNSDEELNTEKQRFMDMPNGFPGIVGAIDCTHVAIVAPPADDENFPAIAFLNRKGYYSINVQIVCNSQLKILAINARFPGSVHDSAIWGSSLIKQELRRIHERGHTNCWLIGDSGYPSQPWLLTPFIGNATEAQTRYNNAHKSTRNVIERLNGVLKGRFRCLSKHRVLHYGPVTASRIINSCAILHNFCINAGELDVEPEEHIDDQADGHDEPDYGNQARAVRDRIVELYFT